MGDLSLDTLSVGVHRMSSTIQNGNMKILSLWIVLICITNITYTQTFKSSATLRLEDYDKNNNCDVAIPDNSDWNIAFDRFNLKGDLAPNVQFTRRDPSSVLRVNGKYYVWYSYSLTDGAGKNAPWDLNDLYYATSSDGHYWEEQGPAVERGPIGSFDHRSVFTTEVFYHDSTFYLVYQAAADLQGVYGKNTIAMSSSKSPHGPWTKLEEPLLSPTEAEEPVFDDNAVHDPCLLYFRDKFYLYYKGEGSENPICGLGVWGLNKQVKWGVAISDSPTGPFIKSEFNPITNTGHEVCVWNSGEGIALMLHQDGPEFGTLQHAQDGVNFEIMGKVNGFVRTDYSTDYPEAAGVYRPVSEEVSPVSGVSWGLCHVLTREQGKYWMYLKRFENEEKQFILDDADNEGIELEFDEVTNTKVFRDDLLSIYPNPVQHNLTINIDDKGRYSLEIISITGQIVKKEVCDSQRVMDLSCLKEGFYILKAVSLKTKKQYRKNFIKAL